MLTIAIISGILWLLLSNAFAFMYGRDSVRAIIKYDIMAALMILSVFLLVAPTFSATVTSGNKSFVYNGDGGIMHVLDVCVNYKDEKRVASNSVLPFAALCGIAIICAIRAVMARIGYGKRTHKSIRSKLNNSPKAFIIIALVAFVMMFIFKFAIMDTVGTVTTSLSLGVCVYIAVAAAVISLIFDFVYKPEKKAIEPTSADTVESEDYSAL